jgi:hypothetical protein
VIICRFLIARRHACPGHVRLGHPVAIAFLRHGGTLVSLRGVRLGSAFSASRRFARNQVKRLPQNSFARDLTNYKPENAADVITCNSLLDYCPFG